jgi:diacylglycerol O-acyltransferase
MARKPFSNVDTAWLRMEDPTNLMMITGVMIFGAPMDLDRLKATIQHRLLRFDRFRQHVVAPRLPFGGYHWKDDPRFDLHQHVHLITLPQPGDQAALQALVSELMSTPLDLSRPLWEIHLVERYGDGCALIARLHHCIADGIALVRVLLSLTDTDPDLPWPSPPSVDETRRAPRPLGALFRPAHLALRTTTRLTETLLQESQEIIDDPSHLADLARLGASGATAFGRLVLRWPDPKTIFKGELGVPKRAAWSAPLPLSEVKSVGRAAGGTINDVLLTAVSGALRRYLQSRGEPVDGLNVRAVVPVNLRPMEDELTLGNKFGLVFLSLPVGIGDPFERLFELKRRMDELKDTPEAMVAFGILNAIGMSPSRIQDIVVNIFGTKGTAVMTNVPGPKQTIYLAGAPLETIMFWVPQSGRLGMGVSILSYAGKVWLGVATDQGLVPDPETIIAEFHAEFEHLRQLTRELAPTDTRATAVASTDSIAALTAQVDEMLQRVTALLEERQRTPEQESQEQAEHCKALTKAGRPCRNRPLPGSDYCRVHLPVAVTGQ